MNLSIIILNWNGKELLESCLPSLTKAVYFYGDDCEIIIIDNGSSDGSIDYLKSGFPGVRIISLKANLGFAKAMNIGIKEAQYSIVIGLNNDTMVEKGFILPLINHFSSARNILAVAAKMLLWDKKTLNFGRAKGNFRFGFFNKSLSDSNVPVNTLYACAGGFAVDKNKFLELGGFDEDIGDYWEDTDLCYRGWKRGWKTLYEPGSIIYHKFHGTALKKYGRSGINRLSGRNYSLFVFKNIHDIKLFYRQLFFLPLLMLLSALAGRPSFAAGILLSFKIWPVFLEKRKIERKKAIFSDREVLCMVNK